MTAPLDLAHPPHERAARAELRRALREDFKGRIALVSSFGAEAAVLLHLVAETDRDTPVIFLETGMLFPATLAYQQDLGAQLGLTDIRLIRPDATDVAREDGDGTLHRSDPDACCDMRKTRPLARALDADRFDAWITGRKRSQGATRERLARREIAADGRIKINPLYDWTPEMLRGHMTRYRLPLHPLAMEGFPSIGCATCTTRVREGEDPRAGRWRGREKTECGIHIVDGKIVPRRAA